MNIFQNFYNILSYRIFGSYSLTANQDLVCTALCALATIVFAVLPFVIVFKIVRFICDL